MHEINIVTCVNDFMYTDDYGFRYTYDMVGSMSMLFYVYGFTYTSRVHTV